MPKESRLYLNFFKTYSPLLLLGLLTGLISSYSYLQSRPLVYNISQLYSLEELPLTHEQKLYLLDDAVYRLRSAEIINTLDLEKSELTITKPTQYTLFVQINNPQKSNLPTELEKVKNYLTASYSIIPASNPLEVEVKKPILIYLVLGSLTGLSFALLLSLTLSYLRKY